MAGFIPNTWAARVLEATAGKTAIATSTVYLGLATALPDDPLTSTLATITELTTAGYARIAVPAFSSATTTPPIKVTTPTAFQFAAFTADQTLEAPWAFLCDVLSGTGGNIRYIFQLDTPVLAKAGDPLLVPASTLVIE